MSESFNPYAEWLDLADVQQRPDHYALLGLPRFESSTDKIKLSADQATARVRSFRPGDKARYWAGLLDELDEARQCLCDPSAKSAYDEQLKGGGASSPAGGEPAGSGGATGESNGASAYATPSAYPPGVGPNAMPQPPRYGPAGPPPDDVPPPPDTVKPTLVGDPALFPPGFGPPQKDEDAGRNDDAAKLNAAKLNAGREGNERENAAPAAPAADYSPLPMNAPGRVPMSRDAAAHEHADHADAFHDPFIDPMAPAAPLAAQAAGQPDPMAPLAMPVGGAYGAPQAAMPADSGAANASVPVGSTVDSAQPTTQRTFAKKEKPAPRSAFPAKQLLIGGIGAAAALALGVAGLMMFWPPRTSSSDVADGRVASVNSVDPADDGARGSSPVDVDPRPNPLPHPTPTPPVVEPTPTPQPQPPVVEPKPPTPEVNPPVVSTPTPQTNPPRVPLTPAEKVELKSELIAARRAMGDRDQSAAEAHLARAQQIARTDEQKEKVERLAQLLHYVKEFWRAVDEGYAQLKPSTTITVNGAEVAIVEVDPVKLILKTSGSRRVILKEELPAGLALAIANTWFTDDPANKVVKGALYLVDPAGRPEETRRLWEEARAAGVDIDSLMPVLDDTYEF